MGSKRRQKMLATLPSDVKLKHTKDAETYRDRIGDRLYHPERVEPDKVHLIKDDIRRVKVILSIRPSGDRFLDVGCSDGSVTLEIAKTWRPKKIIGIDVAPSAIKEAKEKLKHVEEDIRKRVKFKLAFIEELDFPDNYFDTIYACETLEHIAPGMFRTAFSNILRMLKDKGKLIISVPNRYPDRKYVAEKRARWKWPTHYRCFSFSSLRKLLKKHFSEIEFIPLYDGEKPSKSIYLICVCSGKLKKSVHPKHLPP